MRTLLKIFFGAGFAMFLFFGFGVSFAGAAPNINPQSPNHWAWNDVVGWIDFCDTNGSACNLDVEVTSPKIEGYASSSVGFIELDCATTPAGNVCAEDWFVSNDSQGGLAGFAWNDAVGWISFCGNESGGSTYSGETWVCPSGGLFPYQVVINETTGNFSGYAWNDVVGWISFNCENSGTSGCNSLAGGVDYKVNTSWRPIPPTLPVAELTSSTFDTCASPATECGAAPNSIVWQGTVPEGNPATYVRFRVASSNNLTGPWVFIGPDPMNPLSYYRTSILNGTVSASIPINQANHMNQRYFRYRLHLNPCNPPNTNCPGAPGSPVITDVILNWSP